jgi:hypothetical protein
LGGASARPELRSIHENLTNPRSEFREFFFDAWRLERDYFYDRNTHGLDWKGIRDRYLPLVDRVSDRNELNDVIAQMVGELSTLHIFVHGGDARQPADQIDLASLGAVLRRDEKAGGYIVRHIYLHDPDLPNEASPLARPDSLVKEGEVIVSIDGEAALSASDERALLRGKAGRKVLLRVKSASGQTRDVLVTPVSERDEGTMPRFHQSPMAQPAQWDPIFRHIFVRPTSEIPNSVASFRTEVHHTRSQDPCQLECDLAHKSLTQTLHLRGTNATQSITGSLVKCLLPARTMSMRF